MRISDWSSDVCSSDLGARQREVPGPGLGKALDDRREVGARVGEHDVDAQRLQPREDRAPRRHRRACHPLSTLGSQRMMTGKASRTATRSNSARKKGITPLKVSLMGMSSASAEMTKTFMPTGGVMRPSSTTMSERMRSAEHTSE